MTAALAVHLLAACTDDTSGTPRARESEAERIARVRDETALVERIRQGDDAALRALMDQYFERTARFAYALLHDRDAAEDVAQDVFARVWEQRAAWRPAISIRAYLFGAARNHALDVLKHRGVRARHVQASLADAGGDTPSVEAELTTSVQLAALTRALAALPERRRAALTLRYQHAMSHAEVGVALGVSAKAAKELIVRTIDALRVELRALR